MWEVLSDLVRFIGERKRYWLAPLVLLLLLVGALLIFAQGSPVGLLLYPLF